MADMYVATVNNEGSKGGTIEWYGIEYRNVENRPIPVYQNRECMVVTGKC